VSDPSHPAEREADANAAIAAQGLDENTKLSADASPGPGLHLDGDHGAAPTTPTSMYRSAPIQTDNRQVTDADIYGASDAKQSPRRAAILPKNETEARHYLEMAVARGGLGEIDRLLMDAELQISGKPPISGTAPADFRQQDDGDLSAALDLLRSQANVVKRDAYAFVETFKANAMKGANALLDASEAEIAEALTSYGAVSAGDKTARSIAANLMRAGSDGTAEAMLMAQASGGGAGSTASPEATNQADLAAASRELQIEWQQKVAPLLTFIKNQQVTTPAMYFRGPGGRRFGGEQTDYFDPSPLALPPGLWQPDLPAAEQVERVKAALTKEREAFLGKWLAYERKHPILAMYRDRKGQPKDLAELQKTGAERQRAMIRQVLPKLRDIYRTRDALRDGDLDPIKLPPAVQMTKNLLHVRPGSMQDRLATDAMNSAMSGGWKDWAIAAVSVGLIVISIAATGGGAAAAEVAVAAEIGGLALDLSLLNDEIVNYSAQKPATNTSMDPKKSLVQRDPSLTELVANVFGVAVGSTGFLKALDHAIALNLLNGYGRRSRRTR